MITSFDQLIGNTRVLNPLKRLIANDKVKNFNIFGGELGTGKSTSSRLLAMVLTCENPNGYNPCLSCEICVENLKGLQTATGSLYVKVHDMTEIKDNASMDEFIREAFTQRGFSGKSVRILEELQELPQPLQSRLLGQLDKLHKSVYLIANCTDVHRLLDTLKSRTSPLIFARLTIEESRLLIVKEFERNYRSEPKKDIVELIVNAGKGIPRDIVNTINLMIDAELTEEELRDYLGEIKFSVYVTLLRLSEQGDTNYYRYIEDVIPTFPVSQFVAGYKEFAKELKFLTKIGESAFFDSDEVEFLESLGDSKVNKILSNSLSLKRDTTLSDLRLNFIYLKELFATKAQKVVKQEKIREQVEIATESRMNVETYNTKSSSFEDGDSGVNMVRRLRNESSITKGSS